VADALSLRNGAASGAAITISSDTIQNITTAVNANSGSSAYIAISSASASTISNNIIDNIVNNSNSTNVQITGISVSGAFAETISNNTISNFSTPSSKVISLAETDSPAGSAIIGILNSASVAGQVISGNILYNFNSTTVSGLNTLVTGIGITSTGSGNIFNNRMGGFTNTATGTTPVICGIMVWGGSFNFYNNSIKFNNAAYTNGVKIYGINHAAATNGNYYHNSVRIRGSASGTAEDGGL